MQTGEPFPPSGVAWAPVLKLTTLLHWRNWMGVVPSPPSVPLIPSLLSANIPNRNCMSTITLWQGNRNLVHLKTAKTIKAHNSREFYLIFLLIVFRSNCSQWFLKKVFIRTSACGWGDGFWPLNTKDRKDNCRRLEEILSKLLYGRNWWLKFPKHSFGNSYSSHSGPNEWRLRFFITVC